MQVEKSFRVPTSRDDVVDRLRDDTILVSLLPGETEIIASDGDHRTTRTKYSALGSEGEATFHFTYLLDGNVRFEKICDGKIWKRLTGSVNVDGDGGGACVSIEMEGTTKAFVPELAIKLPLDEQMKSMTDALRGALQ